jgi:HSP20 family protein
MALVRFDPYPELTRLSDEMTRMFGRALGDVRGGSPQSWTPALDVIDTPEAIVLKADLPGVSPEDVSIEFHEDTLTLTGERRFTDKVEDGRYHRLERSYGRFSRSLTLPKDVKADEISATFEEGVLEVRVPKAEEVKPRQIRISAGNGTANADTISDQSDAS